MEFNKKAAVAFFALAFLFLAYCGEATRICSETNMNYHGPCKSNKNCASACVNEGYDGGYCSRRKRRHPTSAADVEWAWWPWPKRVKRCKCTKKCQGPSSPAGGGGDLPPYGDEPPYGEGPPFAMAGMRV